MRLLLAGVIVCMLLLFGCANVDVSCTGKIGEYGMQYGLKGKCTFHNTALLPGSSRIACGSVYVTDQGSVVKQEDVCVYIGAGETLERDFFIDLEYAGDHQYEVEYYYT